MKKILIATGIYPPDIGGPATMLESLSSALRQNDFDVKVITYSQRVDYGDKNIFRITKGSFLSPLVYFLKMVKLSLWSDVIYVTDTYSVGYFAYLIKKIFKKKYILRFAGDSAWEISMNNNWTKDYIVDFGKKIYGRKIEKLKNRRTKIIKNADKVIAVSKFIAGIAGDIGASHKDIKVIYNSVDFMGGASDEKIKAIKDKFQDKKIISTACRLTPWKGVDGLIKIIKRLDNSVLLVLGDGPHKEELKVLAKGLGVEDRVVFMGSVEHKEIVNYYKASDLFVLNTNYEALSHTLLEVMKAGTPIITTNIGGNPEVIEDGKSGLLVEYNNESQLISAVEKVFGDEWLANNMTKKAQEKLNNFNWKTAISQTIELLNDL